MSELTISVDTREFARTLRAYTEVSKTEPTKLVVRKAFFIARAACRLTPRVNPEDIKKELGASDVNKLVLTKRGKFSKSKRATRSYAFNGSMGVDKNTQGQFTQRIFKILAARLRKMGEPIPPPEEFRKMALKMLNARIRSVAFLASGFLPAIRRLAQIGTSLGIPGMAPRERQLLPGVKQKENNKIGSLQTYGMGSPKVAVTIVNSANATRDHKNALIKYAGPALQAAFAQETASTKAEIEKRYRNNARRLGIRTN